ncbi:GNAT family N-acetyltransferase [Planotetraspora thailandica]|nr:GNAT family N-acetyltransferase [Planotetraspora thailandica]
MLPREPLTAGPVILRIPEDKDLDPLIRAYADPAVTRFIPFVPEEYGKDDALAWFAKAQDAWEGGGAQFVIADAGTGEFLGASLLKPPDRFGNSEIGYMLARWARGRGVATAAVRSLTDWGFSHGMPRIELLTGVENIASQRVAYRSGYTREGVLREEYATLDGVRHDSIAFSRLAGDPSDPIEPFLPFFPGGFPSGSLTDGVVRLSPLVPGDADDYHAMQSDPESYKYSVPPQAPSYADSVMRCRHAGMWWLSGQRVELAIRRAGTGAFAGHIQLANVVAPLEQAMVGYSLHRDHRGHGLMTRAVNLLVEWAFEHTALHRIIAGTALENTASQRVLERAGFTREFIVKGLLPRPDGTRVDDLQWARHR